MLTVKETAGIGKKQKQKNEIQKLSQWNPLILLMYASSKNEAHTHKKKTGD
jgi:hypothetical protein